MGLAGVCKKFYWYDVRVFVGAWPVHEMSKCIYFQWGGGKTFHIHSSGTPLVWYIKFSYSIVQAQKWMRRSGSFSVRDAQGPYFHSEV